MARGSAAPEADWPSEPTERRAPDRARAGDRARGRADGLTTARLPAWAEEMRQVFRAGATSQFVLHGNVFDLVPAPDGRGGVDCVSLTDFLTGTMFQPFDVVIRYDRGRGMRIEPPASPAGRREARRRAAARGPVSRRQGGPGVPQGRRRVPRRPGRLRRGGGPGRQARPAATSCRATRSARSSSSTGSSPSPRQRTKVQDGKVVAAPAQGRGDPRLRALHRPAGRPHLRRRPQPDAHPDPGLGGEPRRDARRFVATVLITENLADLNRALVESPYSAKIRIDLPTADEIRVFVDRPRCPTRAEFAKASEVSREVLADKLVGLSRVSIRAAREARAHERRADHRRLPHADEEGVHREGGRRPPRVPRVRRARSTTSPATTRPRPGCAQDAVLLKRGRTMAIPMGYLLTGRIGTGKTYLVECLAGEIGIPCVELKNFRDKWVGATEGNLEKVFSILHALGQVIVFVDEADQVTGKRGGGDGDSGLSGRVYGMLAKEMSDTRNRGKIIWIFATSRPDLVEVDLKRQGRLDVHIPLFPPGDAAGRATLFAAMAHKLKLPIKPEELPPLPDNDQIGGNEMEGILVRALRELRDGAGRRGARGGQGGPLPECIARAIADFRPRPTSSGSSSWTCSRSRSAPTRASCPSASAS